MMPGAAPLLLLLLLLAGGAADPEPSTTTSQPTATEAKQPGDDMKTIVELVGGWPNLGGGVLAALLAVALVQWLFSLREASLDAAYKEHAIQLLEEEAQVLFGAGR